MRNSGLAAIGIWLTAATPNVALCMAEPVEEQVLVDDSETEDTVTFTGCNSGLQTSMPCSLREGAEESGSCIGTQDSTCADVLSSVTTGSGGAAPSAMAGGIDDRPCAATPAHAPLRKGAAQATP
mmetsp:Transcript_346/g.912  ORF Transcript_346/g.912 Transcript_346/m.912 type:complete len:125 (+) Transcript_346:963-1337(+)